MDVYSALIEPLPGWKPAELPAAGRGGIDQAVDMILGYLPDLTAEQRKKVLDFFDTPLPGAVQVKDAEVHRDSGTGRRVGLPMSDPPPLAHLQEIAEQAQAYYRDASRLGFDLAVPYEIAYRPGTDRRFFPLDTTGQPAYAGTVPLMDMNDPNRITGIAMAFNEDRMSGLDERTVRKIVAHEMFHAFTMSSNQGRFAGYSRVPQWVIEGGAEYASESFAGPGVAPAAQNSWVRWLRHPQLALERRSYDGIGFFSLIAQGHGNVWSLLPNRYPQGADPVQAFLNLAPPQSGGTIMNLWADTTVHDPSIGLAFVPAGPGMPVMSPDPVQTSIPVDGAPWTGASTGGSSARFITFDTAGAFTLTVDATADAGVVVFANHAQQSWGNSGKQATYCVAAGGCQCPNHADAASPGTIPGVPGAVTVVLSSAAGLHPGTASMSLRLQSRDQACAPPPPSSLAQCLVGRWKSDPMHATLDLNGTTMHLSGGDGILAVLDQDGHAAYVADGTRPLTGTAQAAGGVTAEATVTMAGTASEHWSVSGDQFVSTPGTGGVHVIETMKVAGQTFTVLNATQSDAMAFLGGLAGGSGQVPPHTMTCDAQHWITTYTLPSGTLAYSWHRDG